MERHNDWNTYKEIMNHTGLNHHYPKPYSLLEVYASTLQELIEASKKEMERRDELRRKENEKWNEEFLPPQYFEKIHQLETGRMDIRFIGEGYYDLWTEKHRYQILRIDEILETKVGHLEVFEHPDSVKKAIREEIGGNYIYAIYTYGMELQYLAGSENKLTEDQLFEALRWNGIDPYGVAGFECPSLEEIPSFHIKLLEELNPRELYQLVKRKHEGEIQIVSAENMNPLYGVLTAEEAEEKWELQPGTVTRRCEEGYSISSSFPPKIHGFPEKEIRKSQNTWLVPYDLMLQTYGIPPSTYPPDFYRLMMKKEKRERK